MNAYERSGRSGAALLIVVVCLIVITTILGAMLRHLLLANRQTRQRARKAQATWLAESAVERAVFALRRDSNYRAEIWEISPEQLDGKHAGQVEIEVSDNAATSEFIVDVAATYPKVTDFHATVRKQIVVSKHLLSHAAEE